MQYFRGADTISTMHYAVFSGDGYYLYYALAVFSGDGYYFYYALCSIFGGWILFLLCTMQYIRREDNFYAMHYEVVSGIGIRYRCIVNKKY